MFDRFYRAESSRSRDSGGTGLGLPIVRDLVRTHNGSVRLTARPDGAAGLLAVVDCRASASRQQGGSPFDVVGVGVGVVWS